MLLKPEIKIRLKKRLEKRIAEQKAIVKTAEASYRRMKKLCYFDDEKSIILNAKEHLEEEKYKLGECIDLYKKLSNENKEKNV